MTKRIFVSFGRLGVSILQSEYDRMANYFAKFQPGWFRCGDYIGDILCGSA
jgi:hypothetical protein